MAEDPDRGALDEELRGHRRARLPAGAAGLRRRRGDLGEHLQPARPIEAFINTTT